MVLGTARVTVSVYSRVLARLMQLFKATSVLVHLAQTSRMLLVVSGLQVRVTLRAFLLN